MADENAKRTDVANYLGALGLKFRPSDGRPGRIFECGCFIPSDNAIPIESCDKHRRAIGV